ncbi:Bifunctional solanapyrone synthase [Colletotrichum viniferum]|nr:Bifunctional solanapyrone synthase [Colletotrichum viniferum]
MNAMISNWKIASICGLILSQACAASPSVARDVSAVNNGPNCQQACDVLAAGFPGRLHYEASDSNFTIWEQKQLETAYVCRVQPTSTDEVSKTLKVLVDSWCKFAVKCGGHSRNPDDSVSTGGVTIDLDLMSTITVSDDRKTASIGGGSVTRQIYAALDPYGPTNVGGRVGQVGAGGFTLGGGTSALSVKYGWALDHVLEYEVVLANASVVKVSESSHPDLYFALRGGGNNFGIVTSFIVDVYEQGPVYTGARTFPESQIVPLSEEVEKIFTVEDEQDTNVGFEYRYTFSPQNGWTVSTTQRYADPVMNPPVFNALNSIPAVGNLTGGINTLASSTSAVGQLGVTRNLFTSLTNYPSLELSQQGLAIMKNLTETRNLTSLNPQLITYSIPAAMMRNSKARGGNALGLEDVSGHLIINLFALSWTDRTLDNAASMLAETFITDFRAAAEELDAFHPFIYINYANKGQDVFGGYGQNNRDRLVEISKAVDPKGVFASSGLWTGFSKVR